MPRPTLSPITRRRRADFGARVRREREAAGLTQRQLAEQLLKPDGTPWDSRDVGDLEAGDKNLPAHLVPDLCAAFGITIARLYGEHTQHSQVAA